VPIDFVSTHVYANDTAQDVFGTDEAIPRNKMVCRAVKRVYDQVKASPRASLPIYWSEFNASYANEPNITDSTMMGPWLTDTIRQCDGLVDSLAFWSFSDVFEEQGVVKEPFYGGYGVIAAGGLHKPSFNAFSLLHRLGDRRIPTSSESVIATTRADGSLAVAVYNLVLPNDPATPRRVRLSVQGLPDNPSVAVSRVDDDHGSLLPAYERMGRPRYPTKKQLEELRKAAEPSPPETGTLTHGEVLVWLPPNGLALIEIRKAAP
jgi:xylan 1,4-beta-xylosidase